MGDPKFSGGVYSKDYIRRGQRLVDIETSYLKAVRGQRESCMAKRYREEGEGNYRAREED